MIYCGAVQYLRHDHAILKFVDENTHSFPKCLFSKEIR
jgi:hypothetical protein